MVLISFSIGVAIAVTCICNQNKLESWLELQTLKRANRRTQKMTADHIKVQMLKAQRAAAKERERGLTRDRVRVYRSIENAAKEGHQSVNMGHYRILDELEKELRAKGYDVDGGTIRW